MSQRLSEAGGDPTCHHVNHRDSCASSAESRMSLSSNGNHLTPEDVARNARQTRDFVANQGQEWPSRLAAPTAGQERAPTLLNEQVPSFPSRPATGSRPRPGRHEPYAGRLPQPGSSRSFRRAPGLVNGTTSSSSGLRARRRQGHQQLLGRQQDVLHLDSNPALSTYPAGTVLASNQTPPAFGTGHDALNPRNPIHLTPLPPPPRYLQQISDEDLQDQEEFAEEDQT